MKLAVICTSVVALACSSSPAAAPADPKGPAILVIDRTNGREFVYFSSFARCEAAADKFWDEDKSAIDVGRMNPLERPRYKCIAG